MADRGAKYADKALSKIDKALQSTYRTASRELNKKLADFNKAFAVKDREKRKKRDNGEITEEEYKDWLGGQVFMRKQWESKVKQVNQVMLHHNEQAVRIINESSFDVFAENYYAEAFKSQWICQNISFNVYNSQAIARLIKENPQLLPEWKIDEKKDYTWNYKKVNNIVQQGIIQGESVEQIAQRLCRDLSSMNESKMRMFARTAITCGQNAGRHLQMEEAAKLDIEQEKRWTATLDGHTRDSHRAMDGETVPWNKPYSNKLMFPGDPNGAPEEVYNCRCTEETIYPQYEDRQKDWREDETIDGVPYEVWKQGKKAAKDWKKQQEQPEGKPEEKKPEEKIEITGIDAIKQKVKDHQGDWTTEELKEVGGLFMAEVEKDIQPYRNAYEETEQEYEEVKSMIAELRKQINDLDAEKRFDEADKLELELNRYVARRNELYNNEGTLWKAKKAFEDAQKDAVLNTLKQIRPVGGITEKNVSEYADLDYYNYQKKKTREKTIEAMNYYPTEWLDKSKAYGTLAPHWTTGRAYYSNSKYRAEIRFEQSKGTNIHELGHRMERAVPEILKAEKAFYDERTAGEQLKWLGSGYGRHEKSREDHFASAYMGKYYDGTAYELVSMGFQYCFTWYNGFYKKDPEMMKWTLGLLAGV